MTIKTKKNKLIAPRKEYVETTNIYKIIMFFGIIFIIIFSFLIHYYSFKDKILEKCELKECNCDCDIEVTTEDAIYILNKTHIRVATALYYPKTESMNISIGGRTYVEALESFNHEWQHHKYITEHWCQK